MRAVLVMIVCAGVVTAARARPVAADTGKPWYGDSAKAERVAARDIFEQGNELVQLGDLAGAAEAYKRAIAIWPSPEFYFNLAVVQLNLVQPVEAYASLNEALAFGQYPLGEDAHGQAVRYRETLLTRLARVEIRCAPVGCGVTVDGVELTGEAGVFATITTPGTHQVTVSRAEYETQTRAVQMPADHVTRVEFELERPTRLIEVRRWAAWKPPALGMAGLALLAGAGYFDWSSSRRFDRFDEAFEAQCAAGCRGEVGSLQGDLVRAEREQTAALALYIVGGAAAIASAALVYVNRKQTIPTKARRDVSMAVVPAGGGARFELLVQF